MGAANRWTSTGGYGWVTPFENGVADVTGCSQIGVVPFYGVKPYVIGLSTKCYFNEFVSMRGVITHDKVE
jgi:hypothetical protein